MRTSSFVTGSVLVLGSAASLAFAQGRGATALYENNCMNCHGDRGQGGGAGTKSLLLDKYLGVDRQQFDMSFFKAIKEGVKDESGAGAGMVAFGETFKDEQIWALVVHIREMQERDRRARGGIGTLKKAVNNVFTTQHTSYRVETIVEKGLNTPWAIDWLPTAKAGADGKAGPMRMLITEKSGLMRVYEYSDDDASHGKLSKPIAKIPEVFDDGQGGLMDVAVHPEYASNGWIYLSFSSPGGRGGMTIFVRGKLKQAGANYEWTDQETIWEPKAEHYLGGGLHFGSRIVFGKVIDSEDAESNGKRYMYFCLGERGRGEMSQDLKRPNGKTFRLYDDGKVPSDNPFVNTAGAYPAMYSYGHRNPQGLVLDLDGNLWDTEHGPRGGDELNLVKPGLNYGWPRITFGIDYSDAPLRTPWPKPEEELTMPVWTWIPSIAACGLDVVKAGPMGEAFPQWRGDLFAGGLAGSVVERLRIRDGVVTEREEVVHGTGRVRDVVCGPDGTLFVVLNDPHRIVRLVPATKAGAKGKGTEAD